ncbi:FecCD family ABC transporter permease [Marinomonas sp.]|uniref:FecCD family ABC transporter permease n=1 Tax=Marinomonas sp. TaxID=1904862 RepID=UPI003BA9DC5F
MTKGNVSKPNNLSIRLLNERLSLQLSLNALFVFVALLFATSVLMAFSLSIGSYDMALSNVWKIVMSPSMSDQMAMVVWEFRIPRILVAVFIGSMLALSGALLQCVTRNSLADPSLIGISQGAGLAVVVISILLPEEASIWRPWAAFFGAILVASLIQSLSWGQRGGSSIRFILIGVGIAAFISSVTSAFMTYGQIDRAMSAMTWLSGSMNLANWEQVRMLSLAFVILLPLTLMLSRSLATLQMGESTAVGLGVSTRFLRVFFISLAVGFAALATAAVGPLGFVGLIAPHVARRVARGGVGMNLLISAVVGAFIVTLADMLGRNLFAPTQIPIGLVTAIIGVPFFVMLLLRTRIKGSY